MTLLTRSEIAGITFIVGGEQARVGIEGGQFNSLTLEDIGDISEVLAEAWEEIAGEEHKPVEVGVKYVAGELSPCETARLLGAFRSRLESDCE